MLTILDSRVIDRFDPMRRLIHRTIGVINNLPTRVTSVHRCFAGLLLAFVTVGCSSQAPTATPSPTAEAPPAIAGTLTLIDRGGIELDRSPQGVEACGGTGGYADIRPRTSVVVRNEDGTTIGSGQLANPDRAQLDEEPVGTENVCRFIFDVDLSETAAFYAIEIASRGELTYSHEDLEALGWNVELTLGE